MTDETLDQRREASGGASLADARIESELRSRLAQLSEKAEELSERLRESETERERIGAELEHLRREHQAVRASISWRVTRPLRLLRGGA